MSHTAIRWKGKASRSAVPDVGHIHTAGFAEWEVERGPARVHFDDVQPAIGFTSFEFDLAESDVLKPPQDLEPGGHHLFIVNLDRE